MKVIQKLALCIGIIVLFSSLCNSQQKIRTVENGLSFPNQPIKIVGKELGGTPFIDNRRVMGEKDWLSRLTLLVKNISSKNIMSFDIDLLIKKKGLVVMGIPIHFRTYSNPTNTDVLTMTGENKTGFLLPGEVVKVKVSDHTMSLFGKELVKYEVEDVDVVTIDLRAVYFDDHSRWMFGQESRPDPKDPGKRIRSNQPAQRLSKRFFGIWEELLPMDRIYSGNSLAFIFPATGRNFFYLFSSRFAAVPPDPPTCVWFVENELISPTCSGFTTRHGCEGADTSCVYENFANAVYASDPGGGAIKGYLREEPYTCTIDPNNPPPPEACSSCETFTYSVFRADAQCGLPGTCGQLATWGCADGLEDIDGVCQRSLAYQQSCEYGYDAVMCSCITGGGGGHWECDPGCYGGFSVSNQKSLSDGGVTPDNVDPCCIWTPVVIDVLGNGFALTGPKDGVDFDFNGDGIAHRMSWTPENSDDAWLVLDRNGNGTIDTGVELFGNMTPQPASSEKNGFLALAEYDKSLYGGNSDGMVDKQDSVFSDLLLWQDTNHNGISESSELSDLDSQGISGISLRYKVSRRTDENGNQFRYQAKIYDAYGRRTGRWVWDVILQLQP